MSLFLRLDAKELYDCNSCGGFAKPLLGYARTYAPAAEPHAIHVEEVFLRQAEEHAHASD